MGGQKRIEQGWLRIACEVAVVKVAYGLDGNAAGFLSAFVAAHAIGHDSQAPFAAEFLVAVRLPIEKGILVIRAL